LLWAADDQLDIRGDDCRWDPQRGWRCAEAPALQAAPSDAVCAVVRQQILIGDALAHGSPTSRRFLAAAMQANLALAQRLGCPPMRVSVPGQPSGAGGAGSSSACATEKRADGTICTTCEGEQPVCAPAKCQSRLTDDGITCSTCIDAKGQTHSDCPDPAVRCQSEVADSGLLCSSCEGQLGPPECLPAECGVFDRCMRCTDPKGRTGVDCSMDYEEVRTGGSLGIMPSNDRNLDWNLAGCSFLWGFGNLGGTTCHYPGTTSCMVSGEDDWQCLSCSYSDGSGSGICTGDGLPDPLANLPSDLPAPGNCVNKLGADGQVACTTCTHADGSATRSCHHPGVADCAFSFEDFLDPVCIIHCTLDDGSPVCLRNSASGPEPIRTNAAR
jgi:hypothetical protein